MQASSPSRLSGLRSYVLLDLASTALAVAAAVAAERWWGRVEAVAVAGTLAENAGFYLTAWLLERRRARRAGDDASPRAVARRLLSTFALAEVVDLVLARPLALALGTWATGSAVSGVVLGGYLADGVFYAVASGAVASGAVASGAPASGLLLQAPRALHAAPVDVGPARVDQEAPTQRLAS